MVTYPRGSLSGHRARLRRRAKGVARAAGRQVIRKPTRGGWQPV